MQSKKLLENLKNFVELNIPEFHEKRLQRLSSLKLQHVLKRKNPYLYKAKNYVAAADLVKDLLDAHLSAQEETLFGAFLEQVAIYVCSNTFGGGKSAAEGIDLEFSRDDCKYIVSIKSGPNWGNSSQIKKMRDNFQKAKRILGTNRSKGNVIAINGCCYGQESIEDKGDYLKLCGQSFWSLISSDENLYIELIEPIGYKAKERNETFNREYGKVHNRFTETFIQEFCNPERAIDWEKLVQFNSARKNQIQE